MRDFSIDLMGMDYGLDSDDIDRLERAYIAAGKPLSTKEDYIEAFKEESHKDKPRPKYAP